MGRPGRQASPLGPAMAAALDDLRAGAVIDDVARARGIVPRILRYYAQREGVRWQNARNRRPDDPVVVGAVEACRRGDGVAVVAARHGVWPRTIQDWCYRAGFFRRRVKNLQAVASAMEDLRAGRVTRVEIASRMGVHLRTVETWARKHSIKGKMGRPLGTIETSPVGIAARVMRMRGRGDSVSTIAIMVERDPETVRQHLARWTPRMAKVAKVA